MKFEHPLVLWALLFLAIPIIIHLFHFKRFKTLFFSSLIFVKQVEQETKSVKKLKHLLILISRILAFIALVLAFAKPYIPLQENRTPNKTTAIFIDNSFSMTNLGSEGQLFELAKGQARQIVSQLTADEKIYLISNEQSPDEQREYTKEEAIEKINQLTISPYSRTFEETANWLQTQAENNGSAVINKFIYISDFQKKSSKKELLLNKQTLLYPVQLIAQKNTNLAVDSAWFTNPNFRLNTPNELNVILKNYGEKTLDNVALNLKTNQTQRDIFVTVRANDTAHVVVNYSDNTGDWIEGKLSVLDEGIVFDDDLFFSYQVQKHNQLVIIDGEDAVPNISTVYGLDDFYKVQSFSSKNIDNSSLQKANTIVLNGLNSYTNGLSEMLVAKAKEGVGIAIFPGKEPNIQELNGLLQKLELSTISRKINEKFAISRINTSDRFFQGVFKKKPKNSTFPSQNNYLKITPSGKIISLLHLENNDPLFIRSSVYNTFLFTSSLSKDVGDFMTNAIFSTCLLRVGEMSTGEKPVYLTIGASEKYPVVQEQPERPIRLINKSFEFIPLKNLSNGKSWISVQLIPNKNIQSGYYAIQDEKKLGVLSLNYNREESSVDFQKMEDFKQQLKEQGFEHIQANSLEKNTLDLPINTSNKEEYWKLLLILALVFFLTEMALIKFWK